MSEYHEPEGELSPSTRNYHRALRSLCEELEAVDWYQQRFERCDDEGLRAILAHNRDEEMEHACMVLEWLRRNMPGWDERMRTYLFTQTSSSVPGRGAELASVAQLEEAEAAPRAIDLGIGRLGRKP